jgi:hypothetical protein
MDKVRHHHQAMVHLASRRAAVDSRPFLVRPVQLPVLRQPVTQAQHEMIQMCQVRVQLLRLSDRQD